MSLSVPSIREGGSGHVLQRHALRLEQHRSSAGARHVDGAGGDGVEFDRPRPVEAFGARGLDEIAALDPAAGDVVAHHRRAAFDHIGTDLTAVVLRGTNGADERPVAHRVGGEQRHGALGDGDDHVGTADRVGGRGSRRRRNARGAGSLHHLRCRFGSEVVDGDRGEIGQLCGKHLEVVPALSAGADEGCGGAIRRGEGADGDRRGCGSAIPGECIAVERAEEPALEVEQHVDEGEHPVRGGVHLAAREGRHHRSHGTGHAAAGRRAHALRGVSLTPPPGSERGTDRLGHRGEIEEFGYLVIAQMEHGHLRFAYCIRNAGHGTTPERDHLVSNTVGAGSPGALRDTHPAAGHLGRCPAEAVEQDRGRRIKLDLGVGPPRGAGRWVTKLRIYTGICSIWVNYQVILESIDIALKNARLQLFTYA